MGNTSFSLQGGIGMAALQGFVDMLRNARLAKGLTFREVAHFVGLSPGNVSEIENGRRLPPKDEAVLEKFAKLLDLNREELIHSAQITRKIRTDDTLGNVLAGDPELALNFYRMVENKDDEKVREALRKAVSFINNN